MNPFSLCGTLYNVTITNMHDCFQDKNKCTLPLHLKRIGEKCLYTYMGDPFVIHVSIITWWPTNV
jgi:hypothetical protein